MTAPSLVAFDLHDHVPGSQLLIVGRLVDVRDGAVGHSRLSETSTDFRYGLCADPGVEDLVQLFGVGHPSGLRGKSWVFHQFRSTHHRRESGEQCVRACM